MNTDLFVQLISVILVASAGPLVVILLSTRNGNL
jgi:hypothetical protein